MKKILIPEEGLINKQKEVLDKHLSGMYKNFFSADSEKREYILGDIVQEMRFVRLEKDLLLAGVNKASALEAPSVGFNPIEMDDETARTLSVINKVEKDFAAFKEKA